MLVNCAQELYKARSIDYLSIIRIIIDICFDLFSFIFHIYVVSVSYQLNDLSIFLTK